MWWSQAKLLCFSAVSPGHHKPLCQRTWVSYGQVRRVLVGPPSNLNPQLAWHKLGAMVKTGFSVLVPSFCVETCLWPSSSAGAGPWLDGTGHRCQDWALGTLALGSATNPPRLPTSPQDLRVDIHKDWFKTVQFEPSLDPYCLLGMSQFNMQFFSTLLVFTITLLCFKHGFI